MLSLIRIVATETAVALIAAALAACNPAAHSACNGMVYSDSGLTRAQFRPCAAEMVKQLDRAQRAVVTMADRSRPRAVRTRARQECLSAAADVAGLLRAAGGTTKLMARWDDARLNEFSFAVIGAKDYYLMVCYYGPKPFEQDGAPPISTRDSGHDKARQILAEIR